MRIRTSEAVDAEAEEAFDFYNRTSPSSAQVFLEEFSGVLSLLAAQPLLGAPHALGTRRKHFQRFPYTLVYRVEEDIITLIALAHHRRRPEYWADRLPRG